jgi:hypothetical protein
MATPVRRLVGIASVVAVVWMLAGARIAGAQGVHVALTPATSQVAPGDVFDIDLEITQADSPFNGFDVAIGYDPAALTLVPLSPLSLQQGTLLTDVCENTFHRFRQGSGNATVSDLLLCAGVSVAGPGQIYHLRFQASSTPQVTQLSFLPGLQFYNAGLYVNPAYSTDAVVSIGTPLSVDPPARARTIGLRVAPNPARGGTTFVVEAEHSGLQRIRVVDIRGRLVRRFEDSLATAGRRTVVWDGRDAAGRPLPAGVYLVTFEAGGRSVSSRVSLVR